jgi:hypothetical protein
MLTSGAKFWLAQILSGAIQIDRIWASSYSILPGHGRVANLRLPSYVKFLKELVMILG